MNNPNPDPYRSEEVSDGQPEPAMESATPTSHDSATSTDLAEAPPREAERYASDYDSIIEPRPTAPMAERPAPQAPQPYSQPHQPAQYQQPHPYEQPYQQPYQQQPAAQPQIVINNSANATNVTRVGGYGLRRRQSLVVHTVLFLTTAGIGNVAYWWYISNWNKKNGF